MPSFSEQLIDLMFEKNIKSHELAAAIGVNTSSVNDWKRGKYQLALSNLLKLADFFGCSLDFIMGRSETVLDYTPQPCPPFYPHFLSVLKACGVTAYRIRKETSIKGSFFSYWKTGADPYVAGLLVAADYLKVSLDYLVGRDPAINRS